ncbi:MAG: GntR family transcriptional regulator [Thiolinea sp.]
MAFQSACHTQEPVTIADRLFLDLRRAILEGDMPAGKKISEPELAAIYGVSRGSLREAIGKLENCNLVTRRPNIGARIVSFSIDQLMEIYQIREAMEGMAARLAAKQMNEQELQHLGVLLERHQIAMNHPEREKREQASLKQDSDLDFHFCIIQGSKNERLVRMLCQDLYDLVRFYRFRLNPSFSPKALQEHELIVEAMQRRDGEMAELLMRHHIRASRERARTQLESMTPEELGQHEKAA